MKTVLNFLLYTAQWLHLRMGGTVKVSRNEIILISPPGRHWFATEKIIEESLSRRDLEGWDRVEK